jgi:hypothetical protein
MHNFSAVRVFVRISAAAFALALPFLWGGCEGSATQTTNDAIPGKGGIQGKLVDAVGTPMAGVEVKAFTVASIGVPGGEAAPAGRAVTDAGGRYRLADMGADVYNIFARQLNGNKGVLIPEVRYALADTDLGTDTLVAPGAIAGKVTVEGRDAAEVFCYIPGSSVAAITDSTGHFTLVGVPPGTYTLRFVAHDLETATRTGILVSSDSVTVLEPLAMLYDSRLAPGIPRQLAAEMIDSARNAFRLSWIPPASADVEAYRLYVEYFPFPDTAGPRINDTLTLTGYGAADTLAVWENGQGFPEFRDPEFRGKDTLLARYRLQAIDTSGNASPDLSNPAVLRFVRPDWIKYELMLTEAAQAPGASGCADTLRFHAWIARPDSGAVVIDSIRYYWTLRFFSDGAGIGEFGGKYYDENGTMHPAEYGPDFTWWDGHPGTTPRISAPDSLEANVRVSVENQGQKDGRQLTRTFKRDPAGCYRATGPAYDPTRP